MAAFEGVFDFLSVLAHYQQERAKSHVLILNSTSMADRGITRLHELGVKNVYAYMDNDEA